MSSGRGFYDRESCYGRRPLLDMSYVSSPRIICFERLYHTLTGDFKFEFFSYL